MSTKADLPSNDCSEVERAPIGNLVIRGNWGSAFEFFITSIGFAVGLGNVWRFPYKVYSNGGAVFLIPYTLALLFIAIPLQFLEASIGQYSKKGPVGIWDMLPILRGIGIATYYSSFIGLVYYNLPLSWACYYFIQSMAPVLPWTVCDPTWAVHPCAGVNGSDAPNHTNSTPAPEMFFYQKNLHITNDITDWGDFVWPLCLCNAILCLILFAGTALGAQSLGKVAYFTSIFPYVILAIMVGFTATLPGSMKGVEFYILRVDWSRLYDIVIWRDAIAQVFFSTNCATGAAIQLASYNKFRHNILRDTTIIPIIDGLTSLFAGFSVFTVLGFMAQSQGVEVKDVVSSGPGLIFITYAEAFSQIPGGNIWAIFFFFMIIMLGLSSQLPMMEMCCSVVSDSFQCFNKSRLKNLAMRFGICLAVLLSVTIFLFGNGYYWYYLVDELVSAMPLIIIGLAELIGIGWLYSRPFICSSEGNKLLHNIEEMIGPLKWSRWYWILTWTFISPITVACVFLYDTITFPPLQLTEYPWIITEDDGIYEFPAIYIQIAWGAVILCPMIMVLTGFWVICYDYKGYKLAHLAMQPHNSWVAANSHANTPNASKTCDVPPLSPATPSSPMSSDLIASVPQSAIYAENVAYACDVICHSDV